MDTIKDILNFLQLLVPAAAAVRVTACVIYMSYSEDTTPYKRKMKNAVIFTVLAEAICTILNMTVGYFGGEMPF